MKPSKRVQKAISFVAILLLLGGLSLAQEPKAKDWGNPVDGLQMRIYLDQAATGQSKVPRFKVELRNVGEKNLLLNLGIMTRSGEQQVPCCNNQTLTFLGMAELKSTFHVPVKLLCPIVAAGVASIAKDPAISRPLIIPPHYALQQSSQSE